MLFFKPMKCCPLFFNRLNVYLTARRGALLGASADQTAQVSFSLSKGQTVPNLFGALFVVLDALLVDDSLSSSFDIVFSLLFPDLPSLPGQTRSHLFEALFVVLDGLLFVDFLFSSFDIVFYLLSEPLGVDFELPN